MGGLPKQLVNKHDIHREYWAVFAAHPHSASITVYKTLYNYSIASLQQSKQINVYWVALFGKDILCCHKA